MLFTILLLTCLCIFSPSLLLEIQNRALYIADPEMHLLRRQQEGPIAGSRNVEDCVQAGRCDRFNITTSDGLSLDNYLCIPPKPRAIIIFFHGNAGSIYDRFPFASQLSRKTNSVVVMADYRGYGLNEGSPSEAGLRRDAIAIIQKTTEYAIQSSASDDPYTVGARLPILVHGHSLGAAVATDAASMPHTTDADEVHIDAIVLSNAFISIREMILHLAEKHFAFFVRSEGTFLQTFLYNCLANVVLPLFQRIHWDNAARVPDVSCTMWFIGAHNDNIVPVSHTHHLYDLAVAKKHKTIYYDVKHNNVHDSAGYYWGYNAFIDSILEDQALAQLDPHTELV
ncbi:Serine protease family S09X [Perkinsela sp. CCAP 1560/4]|nr:Serine protease family S09X [Perkinsela sp. CCAP 1560/4]|eukprot:KNH04068.1 Serine protease family S09X [Perkinsela sp. CCAP 1560/4]